MLTKLYKKYQSNFLMLLKHIFKNNISEKLIVILNNFIQVKDSIVYI